VLKEEIFVFSSKGEINKIKKIYSFNFTDLLMLKVSSLDFRHVFLELINHEMKHGRRLKFVQN